MDDILSCRSISGKGRKKEGRMGSRVFHLEEVLSRVTELSQGEKIELLDFR